MITTRMITPTCLSAKSVFPFLSKASTNYQPPIPKFPSSNSKTHKHKHINLFRIPFSSSKNGSSIPPESSETGECPVPFEQQPINEFKSLSDSFPFSWASAALVEYCSRLFVLGASFALFVGLPVAWLGSVGPESDPLKRVLAAASSGLFVVTLAVVRMYLGWAYVGNRLLSATVEYEETGWYDGQVWVKTAEVLARDRLLGSFSVKPVLARLKNTLVALAISLYICATIFINLDSNQRDAYVSSVETDGTRAIPRVYSEESARAFEPDAFCGESGVPR